MTQGSTSFPPPVATHVCEYCGYEFTEDEARYERLCPARMHPAEDAHEEVGRYYCPECGTLVREWTG